MVHLKMTPKTIQTTRDDFLVAGLAGLAITIHLLESALPSPVPGFKPGLANVVTIIALIIFGWRTAAWLTFLRIVVGSLIFGSFLSPTFILSLSGGLASILVLGLAVSLPGRGLGPIGYSVVAAMVHMAAQFYVAYQVFIPHPGLLHLVPILMTAAVIFGLLSGMVCQAALPHIKR